MFVCWRPCGSRDKTCWPDKKILFKKSVYPSHLLKIIFENSPVTTIAEEITISKQRNLLSYNGWIKLYQKIKKAVLNHEHYFFGNSSYITFRNFDFEIFSANFPHYGSVRFYSIPVKKNSRGFNPAVSGVYRKVLHT